MAHRGRAATRSQRRDASVTARRGLTGFKKSCRIKCDAALVPRAFLFFGESLLTGVRLTRNDGAGAHDETFWEFHVRRKGGSGRILAKALGLTLSCSGQASWPGALGESTTSLAKSRSPRLRNIAHRFGALGEKLHVGAGGAKAL